MWDEEKAHLAKFNQLIPKYKARPSALLPLWNIAGFALGKTDHADETKYLEIFFLRCGYCFTG